MRHCPDFGPKKIQNSKSYFEEVKKTAFRTSFLGTGVEHCPPVGVQTNQKRRPFGRFFVGVGLDSIPLRGTYQRPPGYESLP